MDNKDNRNKISNEVERDGDKQKKKLKVDEQVKRQDSSSSAAHEKQKDVSKVRYIFKFMLS
jgi:hypothetical protein